MAIMLRIKICFKKIADDFVNFFVSEFYPSWIVACENVHFKINKMKNKSFTETPIFLLDFIALEKGIDSGFRSWYQRYFVASYSIFPSPDLSGFSLAGFSLKDSSFLIEN